MRNKIKQIMNKEEGFTLVELLAVIVILGIIVAIAIPAVGSVMDNAQGDADDAETELIIDAARLFEIEAGNTIGAVEAEGVKVTTLIDGGYLNLRGSDDDTSGTVIKTVATETGSSPEYRLVGRTSHTD